MRGVIVSECLLQEFARGFRRGQRLPADTVPQNSDEGFYQQIPSYLPLSAGRRTFSRFTRSRMM